MNWLASFTVRVTETENRYAPHYLRRQRTAGRTGWEMLEEEVDGCCWRFPEGEVSYFSLVPLADVETRILLDLKFLDRWCVTVSQETPQICDVYGGHWSDFRR